MKIAALFLSVLLSVPALAASPDARQFTELPPGRYTIGVSGMISTMCARAIASEWGKLPEVESVHVDFEKASAVLAVRLDRTVKVTLLAKTLRKAEKIANLGVRFEMRAITYRIGK